MRSRRGKSQLQQCKSKPKRSSSLKTSRRQRRLMKAWREQHRRKYLAGQRAYYRRHREEHQAQMQTWRRANREKYLAGAREWRKANLEKHNLTNKEWRKANRSYMTAYYKMYNRLHEGVKSIPSFTGSERCAIRDSPRLTTLLRELRTRHLR